ncbi:MAG: glycosyltransferase family 2 protein [Rhodobacteraceae bacterium]|nr:glycosyltransferase family 2 protein [Paracoccaceae bacterium]
MKSAVDCDISIVITAHREGLLSAPCGKSALLAKQAAEAEGLRCQTIVVLDRADELTSSVLHELFGEGAVYLETDEGDPGQSRNRGVEQASGTCVSFLDGDDLWSENWLVESYRCYLERPDVVYHPACLMRFGDERLLFWHVDSECRLCDPEYLLWSNYWDAMSFAEASIFRKYPFKANDLALGFGHEDWHWSAWTLQDGVQHKPVAETIHFKRGRPGSQMSQVNSIGGVSWPVSRP